MAAGGADRADAIAAAPAAHPPEADASEWGRAKAGFETVFDEAATVVDMFEQEKKRILGLTQALSQVADSFEKLHSKFNDVEGRVKSFEGVSGRLSYRSETTFEAIQECKTRTAELANNCLALRAEFDGAERILAQHNDSIRILTEENRSLRDALSAVERDNRLIVNEIARMRSEIAMLDRTEDTDNLFEAPDAGAPRPAPLPADRKFRAAGAAPRLAPDAMIPSPTERKTDQLITEISESIEFHKSELGWMQVQAENLKARLVAGAGAGTGQRAASPQVEAHGRADRHDVPAVAARMTSERKLAELKTLSSSYQALVQDLEKSRAALTSRDFDPEETPEAIFSDLSESSGAPPSDGVGPQVSKINGIRSMYEKRTEELKAELLQERRERQLAECSLKVSRTERLQLQRELAKVRATGWRKISPNGTEEPIPARRA